MLDKLVIICILYSKLLINKNQKLIHDFLMIFYAQITKWTRMSTKFFIFV